MAQLSDHEVESLVLVDDGTFPNSRLPVLIYRRSFPVVPELARIIELSFAKNGWTNGWRNGIYDYAHYHSTVHEVLGCYEGRAQVQLGGPGGHDIELSPGDTLVIPAGVAHRKVESSLDFHVVGAYDAGLIYDMNRGNPRERPGADQRIGKVPLPQKDPVWGALGPLLESWVAL